MPTMTINTIHPFTFTVPLGWKAHAAAEQQRRSQRNPEKAKQVYLNTLAVYAVHIYLQCQGFNTDWQKRDSANPVMQTLLDSADLPVKHCGTLECRPVLPDAETVYIPAEVFQERIAYVAVQFNDSLREATLLGFAETVTTQTLLLEKLQPLENLTVYLNQIRQANSPKLPVNLRQWLENSFEKGWQTVESLLGAEVGNVAFAFRDASQLQLRHQPIVKRAKIIDLGMALADRSVALLVAIIPLKEQKISILIQVHPGSGERYLSPNLQLTLLSEAGETLQEVSSRSLDNFIQLPRFRCNSGERFTIQVSLQGVSVSEEFFVG